MPLTLATNWYVLLSLGLFGIGSYGLMTQASGIKILMSIELMLNAANVNFVAFASHWNHSAGYVFALFSIAVAAAEAAVGLAILVNLSRLKGRVDVDAITELRW
jgi:NADH-quinone oxidoreductase subunit K